MDVVALIEEAESAGVGISLDADGELVIEAKQSQRNWLGRLRPHKAEIKALLNGASTVEKETWPVPKTLPSALPKVAEFDDSLLPEVARPMVRKLSTPGAAVWRSDSVATSFLRRWNRILPSIARWCRALR